MILDITYSIDKCFEVVADCSYAISVGWSSVFDEDPQMGTAIAISPHYLLTAAHLLYWDEDLFGPVDVNAKYK